MTPRALARALALPVAARREPAAAELVFPSLRSMRRAWRRRRLPFRLALPTGGALRFRAKRWRWLSLTLELELERDQGGA